MMSSKLIGFNYQVTKETKAETVDTSRHQNDGCLLGQSKSSVYCYSIKTSTVPVCIDRNSEQFLSITRMQ